MQEIQQKIFSISGHVSIRQFTSGSLYEEKPLELNQAFIRDLKQKKLISHAQTFIFKPALLKSDQEVEGVVLKGIGDDFQYSLFQANLPKGIKGPPKEDEIWMSKRMASKLNVASGQSILLFFLQNPPRYRKMTIGPLFNTGLEDVDNSLVMVNRSLVQEMNEWAPTQVGGFELLTPDFNRFGEYLEQIEPVIPYHLAMEPITHSQAMLFDWLNVIGRNVLVMFILISLVSGFNMAATLLIMVLERRQMVGILKAIGTENQMIRQIFYRNGLRIIVQGLLFGNLIGLSLAFLQYQFGFIPLDEENYYLNRVPIAWDWVGLVSINLGVILITSLVLFIPVRLVNRIQIREALLTN